MRKVLIISYSVLIVLLVYLHFDFLSTVNNNVIMTIQQNDHIIKQNNYMIQQNDHIIKNLNKKWI